MEASPVTSSTLTTYGTTSLRGNTRTKVRSDKIPLHQQTGRHARPIRVSAAPVKQGHIPSSFDWVHPSDSYWLSYLNPYQPFKMAFINDTSYFEAPVLTGCRSFPSGKSRGPDVTVEQAATEITISIKIVSVSLLNIYCIRIYRHLNTFPSRFGGRKLV